MRAAVLAEDHTFEVLDIADPTPGPGELVLRVIALRRLRVALTTSMHARAIGSAGMRSQSRVTRW